MFNKPNRIEAVDVYLDKRKTREYVGRLFRLDSNFVFTYNKFYLYKERAIPLGPDLPLSAQTFTSTTLFPSFEDRIPSKENPAYPEYCRMVGIDPSETDLLTLVATLGQKGPSSFIFVPAPQPTITSNEIINFRKHLNLTVREFSELFDFAPATIHRIEKNKTSGRDALKRLEIYYCFPEIALAEAKRNWHKINEDKKEYAEKILRSNLDKSKFQK